jgi:hypothetical protein
MKTKTFIFIAALFAATALHAQQISVVAPGGTTTLYTSLDDAITGAEAGSTLYLSGGGFQIGTKITKKLTLIGIGHRADNDNADGNTIISGNLYFEGGADNSTVMGVYLSGDVNIGTSQIAVNTILVRYCNINSIQIQNSNCQGVVINQNYIRAERSNGGNSSIIFSNNILNTLGYIIGGTIIHNVIIGSCGYKTGSYAENTHGVYNSNVSNNIIRRSSGDACSGGIISHNTSIGDNAIVVDNWDDVFVGPNNGINPTSNFALKGPLGKNAGTDGTDIGIYGGTGFSNSALPPGPRIVSKKVSEQTDANGNLRVEIKVSAQ